jgi:SAM-dependent methyltransferase
MAPPLTHLPRLIPADEVRELIHGERHPMREVTRATAFEDGSWTRERASEVASFFDVQSTDWDARFGTDESRVVHLDDALRRGGPIRFGRCADIGCGTGVATTWLARHFEAVVGLDLSPAMLRHAPSGPGLVLADNATLPIASASQDAVVLMNAFLFANEVARVLAPDGVVVWISSIGADTPIYLPPDEVADTLPGAWTGVWSEAADGTWAVLRRA